MQDIRRKKPLQDLKSMKELFKNYESGANVPDWDMFIKSVNFTISPIDFIFFGSELRLKRDKANN